jgi:hypothetical protein
VFPYQFLRSDQTVRQSVYSQFIIFGTQDHYLAGLDAECTAKRSRDNTPPLLVHARMTFLPIDDIAGCAPAGSTNTEAAPPLLFFARVGTPEVWTKFFRWQIDIQHPFIESKGSRAQL